MDYRYTYLLMGLLFTAVWLYLYWKRKDERRELLTLSSMFAVFGIAADFLYVKDWWQPESIIGVIPYTGEALITAFGIIGVGAVMPEYVFRLKDGKAGRIFTKHELYALVISILVIAALFYGSFYLLGTNSLIATIFALIIPTVFMLRARPDLIRVALLNGFLLVAVAVGVYATLELITPGWVDAFYLFRNTPRILLAGVPIDDVIFYFCGGVFFGTFYEWWQGIRRFPVQKK